MESEKSAKAIALVVARGYETTVRVPWEVHLSCKNGTQVDIDLHREIIPKHLSGTLNSDYAWSHLESLDITETTVPTISTEANILILCLNGNKECWKKLNRICDLAELINANPNLNWQQVFNDAQTMRFERIVSIGLLLAVNLLEVSLPKSVSHKIYQDPLAISLSQQISDRLFERDADDNTTIAVKTTLFHIKTRERWRDKFQSYKELMKLSGWLQPSAKDRDLIALPQALSILYYSIRPVRVLMKYSKIWRW